MKVSQLIARGRKKARPRVPIPEDGCACVFCRIIIERDDCCCYKQECPECGRPMVKHDDIENVYSFTVVKPDSN